jgi:hypothetical protein
MTLSERVMSVLFLLQIKAAIMAAHTSKYLFTQLYLCVWRKQKQRRSNAKLHPDPVRPLPPAKQC